MADSEGHSFKIRLDSRILDLARRQHGHVARFQLLELGAAQGLIAGRLAAGAWVAVHQGVYCIGPRRNDPVSRAAAAVLACDPGAVLSHSSAASLWGLLPRWEFPLHVTAERRRERPGIVTHRCQALVSSDNSLQLGVKVTSPARTLLDLAPTLNPKQLTRTVNNALREHDVRPDALHDVIERNRYHPGTKLLKPFLDLPGQNPTNSSFEDDFLPFIAKYGFPTPLTNVWVNGRQVDIYFPDHNLIVELDGWDYHKDRHAFEDDRERDAHQLAHGLRTLRITRDRFKGDPDREAARLQQILDQA
ncbi:MAG TPA: hypothetical protein VGG07_23625 [Solirubrobacteraceae bacterium]